MKRRLLLIAIAALAVAACDTATPADEPAAIDRGTAQVARIVAAYVAPDELVFEPADLLVGEEAIAAAEADGAEAFDFYVRDHPDRRVTLPVAADVRVSVVDCAAACEEGAPSDYGTLTRTADPNGLYRVTILDGTVTAIDAIYLP